MPGPFRPVYEKAVCDEGIASYALLRGLVIATRGTELTAPIIRPGYHRRCESSAPPSPGSPGGRLTDSHDELLYVIRKPMDRFARVV